MGARSTHYTLPFTHFTAQYTHLVGTVDTCEAVGMYEGRVGIYWGGTFGPERKPRAVIEPITQLPPLHPLSPPPSPEYKEEFVKYFRRQSAVLDTKLVSHVSFKMHFPGNPFVSNSALHATVDLSFSPFLRRLFNFCAPPFLTPASYRVPQVGFPKKILR